jgi:hypothetical protein
MQSVFTRSYLLRGAPTTKDARTRLWTTPNDNTLDKFFGESAKHWSAKGWTELKNNSTLAVDAEASGNGRTI